MKSHHQEKAKISAEAHDRLKKGEEELISLLSELKKQEEIIPFGDKKSSLPEIQRLIFELDDDWLDKSKAKKKQLLKQVINASVKDENQPHHDASQKRNLQ